MLLNARRVCRSPLLGPLAAFAAGITAARRGLPGGDGEWLGVVLAVSLTVWLVRGRAGPWGWAAWGVRGLLAAGFFGLGCAWMSRSLAAGIGPGVPDPPREVAGTLEVERVFRYDRQELTCQGIGWLGEIGWPGGRRRVYFRVWDQRGGGEVGRAGEVPLRSTRLEVRGMLAGLGPERVRDAGFREYLEGMAVRGVLGPGWMEATAGGPRPWWRWAEALRLRMEGVLREGEERGGERSRIFASMLLGGRELLPEEWKERYIRTGTMHLFAISGLHVVALAGTIHYAWLICRGPPRWREAVGLVLLAGYVVATGCSPSAVRALAMVGCYWGARVLGRQGDPFPALVGSAWLLLLVDPRQWGNAGFQLSYAVVAGILLHGLVLGEVWAGPGPSEDGERPQEEGRIRRGWRRLCREVGQALAIGISASLASTPLILRHFEVVSPVSLPLNLGLVPLAGLLVVAGCLSLLCGLPGWEGGALYFNRAAWLILDAVNGAVAWADGLPGASWALRYRSAGLGEFLCLAVLLAMLVAHRRRPDRTLWLPSLVLVAGLLTLTVPVTVPPP